MALPPTSPHQLDEAVEAVARRQHEWPRVSVRDRIALLRRCLDDYLATADEVVQAGCRAKGVEPGTPMEGEEWMSGPVPVLRQIRLFIETLREIERNGAPRIAARAMHRARTGELAVRVFPRDVYDALFYPGTRIDVWMQPGIDEGSVRETTARVYREPGSGAVALVLGAGNVAAIAPADVLHKLFVENRVVVLKMHPVNDYLGPLLERAFRALIDPGYLRIVYGDVPEGQYVIHHPQVDEVHMTGSTTVHDRIVWGDTAEEQARRRAAGNPKVTKRVTSELGCVTPAIVVPGAWTTAELQYQAEHFATMVAHSASCTCTSAKLAVTWRGWPERQAFLDRVERVLAERLPRLAYYPGASDRYARFLGAYAQAKRLRTAGENSLACATIYGVEEPEADSLVLREESWSPVLVETPLDARDPAAFLEAAVRFCNDRVFGTLSAAVIVDPRSYAAMRDEVDRGISSLRYGTVSVNHWSAVAFGLGNSPWGAYPGHSLEDVGSGIGVVHNSLMFERPLKSVVWGPFVARPKPAWFVTHRRAHVIGRLMAEFEASPSAWRVPALAVAGLRP